MRKNISILEVQPNKMQKSDHIMISKGKFKCGSDERHPGFLS
jgi:hypothetical protein